MRIVNTSGFAGDGASLGESWVEADPNALLSRVGSQLRAKDGPAMAWWNLV